MKKTKTWLACLGCQTKHLIDWMGLFPKLYWTCPTCRAKNFAEKENFEL